MQTVLICDFVDFSAISGLSESSISLMATEGVFRLQKDLERVCASRRIQLGVLMAEIVSHMLVGSVFL